LIWPTLMIAARTVGGRAYVETVEEMDRELTSVIEDFMRAVDVKTLRLAKRSGRHTLSRSGESSFSLVLSRASRARANRARTRRTRRSKPRAFA